MRINGLVELDECVWIGPHAVLLLIHWGTKSFRHAGERGEAAFPVRVGWELRRGGGRVRKEGCLS